MRDLKIAADSETSAEALSDSLRLARRHRLSANDACYLELALRKQRPLVTLDKDLLMAAKRAGVARFDPRGTRLTNSGAKVSQMPLRRILALSAMARALPQLSRLIDRDAADALQMRERGDAALAQ